METPVEKKIIGQFYDIPCISLTPGGYVLGGNKWAPIFGPIHQDADFFNFPYDHVHIDFRFLSNAVFRRVRARYDRNCDARGVYKMVANSPHQPITMRKLECKRDWPSPYAYTEQIFSKMTTDECRDYTEQQLPKTARGYCALRAAFADKKMTNMVCPHKGMPLDEAHREGDVVTCPGHGLKWNVVTGEAVG